VRRSTRPLRKHTLNLFEGDYEALQAAYPRQGAAEVIRLMIRRYIENYLEATNDRPNKRTDNTRSPL
jgi:hypothetical protein